MKINKNIIVTSVFLLFFLCYFVFLYYPATQGHYLIGEDYARIWTSEHSGINKESFGSYVRTIPIEGRPLETLYYYFTFNKYINVLKSYEPVNTVRFIGIIGLGILAYILFLIFKENKYRTDHAFFLSILICSLPPFQLYVARLICVIFIFSVLLSALSILVLYKALYKQDEGGKVNRVVSVLAAVVLLVSAFLIYPPTATTYWAMALIPLIMIKDEDFTKKWRFLFTIFITGFISMISFFVCVTVINYLMHIVMVKRGSLIWITDIYPKIVWFITNPLYTSLNLWNVVRSTDVALFVGGVIISGILCGIGRVIWQINVEKKGPYLLRNSLSKYFLVFVLIPLSYISHLVVKGNMTGLDVPLHRTIIGIEMIVILLFYWGLMNITELIKSVLNISSDMQKHIVTVLLVFITVSSAFVVHHNIDKYFVKLHTNEFVYIKNAIKEYGVSKLSQVSNIYLLVDRLSHETQTKYGEYYRRSASIGMSGRSLTNLALYELGVKSKMPVDYIIWDDDAENLLPENENILIIDITKIPKLP